MWGLLHGYDLSFIQRTTPSSERSCQGLITLGPSSEGLGALRATTLKRSIYSNRLSRGPKLWSWSLLVDQSESNSTNSREINLWDSSLQWLQAMILSSGATVWQFPFHHWPPPTPPPSPPTAGEFNDSITFSEMMLLFIICVWVSLVLL